MEEKDIVYWINGEKEREEKIENELLTHFEAGRTVLMIVKSHEDVSCFVEFFLKCKEAIGDDDWKYATMTLEWQNNILFRTSFGNEAPSVLIYDDFVPGEHGYGYDLESENEIYVRRVFLAYRDDHLLGLKGFGPHVHVVDCNSFHDRLFSVTQALMRRRGFQNLGLVNYRLKQLCYEETDEILPHCNSFEIFFQANLILKQKQYLSYDDVNEVEHPDIVYQHEGDIHPRPWSCRVLYVSDRIQLTAEEKEK